MSSTDLPNMTIRTFPADAYAQASAFQASQPGAVLYWRGSHWAVKFK